MVDVLAAQFDLTANATSPIPQHIILRDQMYENLGQVDSTQLKPEVLGTILQCNPHVFRQQQQQWNGHPQASNIQQSMMHSPHNRQQQICYSSSATHVPNQVNYISHL